MKTTNMTVRARLIWSFGGLAAIVLLVSALAVVLLGQADARYRGFVDGIHARVLQSYEVRTAADRRAVAARNLVLAAAAQERDAEKARALQAHGDVQQHLARLEQMAAAADVPAEAKALVAAIASVEKSYAPVVLAIVELASAGKRDAAIDKINQECRPLLAALERAGQAYSEYIGTRSAQLVAEAAAGYARERALLVAGCLLAFVAAAVAGWLMTRSLSRALGAEPAELGAVARRVAAGDLSPVAGAGSAVQGSVLASLAAMQQGLAEIVGRVRTGSDGIATASAQIASGNTDLSQRTEEQASNLQQTAASMEQLSGTVKASAETAEAANRLAAGASQAARRGGELVGQVVSTMQDIATASTKIADIIGVIDGIAFQTNILALNAAVEAARAGEQGRGFAVVASEVRTLAGRSAEAAREIKGLIGASVEKVQAGARQVDEAGASMSEIVRQVQRVSQMISELSSASAEQSQGIGQVGDAVQQLDQVTQQNAALVEETAAAAESLRHQATQLAEVMSRFRLDGAGARSAAPGTPMAANTPTPARAGLPPPAARPAAAKDAGRDGATSAQAAARRAEPAIAAAAVPGDDWTTF
ncbi:MAG: MCP four helix bundle domain-containing protein [Proteobacteria bacterium]|nr:MCP four helix bundle domain-containing protein [Pseudomonadota bacterium]